MSKRGEEIRQANEKGLSAQFANSAEKSRATKKRHNNAVRANAKLDGDDSAIASYLENNPVPLCRRPV